MFVCIMFAVAVLPIPGDVSQHACIHGTCVTAETRDHASGVNDTNVVGEVPVDDIHCGSGIFIPVTSGSILDTPRSLTSDGHQIVTGDVYISFLSIFLFFLFLSIYLCFCYFILSFDFYMCSCIWGQTSNL